MKIISFAYTTLAFLAGRKTRTRREWADDYASRWREGEPFQAWNHVPRVRSAKRVGYGRIVAPLRKEHISTMPDEDFEREGFAYLAEQGIKMWGKEPKQAFDDWRDMDKIYWIVDFAKITKEESSNEGG